jgi:hypothetical protein
LMLKPSSGGPMGHCHRGCAAVNSVVIAALAVG